MSGEVVLYGDAAVEVVTALRAALSTRSEPYAAGATVGGRVPVKRTADLPGFPYVQVESDGTTSIVRNVAAYNTVRVTVWHRNADLAHDLAGLASALLCAATPDGQLATCAPLTGPLAAVDPDSGTDLSSITVSAVMRGVLA